MLDFAREAVAMAEGKDIQELRENRQLGLAVIHLVELVGEAASQIPKEIQLQYPQIPWPRVISMRNRLIHGYNYIDYRILRDTITEDLPPLISILAEILSEVSRRGT
jgi:uncharacterized protein with HEPN domain